ncbi:MAG TPA: hypothetical protein PLD38_14235 [Pyrinomonadaceae bacterium]|nr:hypothetical protein [Chloracidobacterium sp.]MBP9936767.1 hypothetical protein [Pyrinomonadaceae bacterium]MBK9437989.1 hypothetical protein [Chloracidobacterium sp.]MBK9765578.1 hypothetical protein [Chloracidobacterium sp.]MBL0242172.1 hypothetical protein [Chloracidobacterium sp.]
MAQSTNDLGRLVSIFGIHPSYLQRAVFVAVLSFLFFIAMMFAFYMRQQFGYFLLATAFLFVYIVTMLSWVVQRKNLVKVYQDGIEYRKFSCKWSEIDTVSKETERQRDHIVIKSKDGRTVLIPASIAGINELFDFIHRHRTA